MGTDQASFIVKGSNVDTVVSSSAVAIVIFV